MQKTSNFMDVLAQVSYDRSSLITPHKQITPTSCAGMCVNKSPQDLQAKGINIEEADFIILSVKLSLTPAQI